jgi:hypothetical protein
LNPSVNALLVDKFDCTPCRNPLAQLEKQLKLIHSSSQTSRELEREKERLGVRWRGREGVEREREGGRMREREMGAKRERERGCRKKGGRERSRKRRREFESEM